MIFLLIFLISSTLRRGDDPYAILGVTRDATAQQIRTAFRKIAFDHHPDRHKGDEDSYRIWLRANDAYEILSNPQRKLKYDQDGTVSENDDQPQHHQNTAGFYGYQNQGSSYTTQPPRYHTPLMTEQLFPYLARDGNEWILFAFQHFDCPSCNDQQQLWEKFAYDVKDYVKVGRLDVTQAPNLAEELKISKVPQFLSVKLINQSKYEVHKLGSRFSTKEAAMNALFKHWKSTIIHFSIKSSSFNNWISNQHQSKVHVVEVRTDTEKSETIHFKYAASKLRYSCVFASVTVKSEEEAKNYWNISFKKLPIVLVFRSNELSLKPIVIDSNGRRILDEIDELSMPIFPKLSLTSIKRICNDWCVAHIDSISDSINSSFIESSFNMPFNTGRISSDSKIGDSFLNNNEKYSSEWIVISMGKKKYWFVNLSKTHDFVSLCSNLYRADDVDDVMKNRKSFAIQKIHFESKDIKELAFDGLNHLNENELMFKCLCLCCAAVLIFLFVCFMKNHKKNSEDDKKAKECV